MFAEALAEHLWPLFSASKYHLTQGISQSLALPGCWEHRDGQDDFFQG